MSTKQGAAVFVGGSKRYAGTTVEEVDSVVTIKKLGKVLAEFTVVEKVTPPGSRVTAWDVSNDGGTTIERLAAVTGCGCGGLPAYSTTETYSGRLSR